MENIENYIIIKIQLTAYMKIMIYLRDSKKKIRFFKLLINYIHDTI